MKKKPTAQVPPPSEDQAPVDPTATVRSRALESAEIPLVHLELENQLPASTVVIPIQHLEQGRTADIPPALLPDAKPGAGVQPMPQIDLAIPPARTGSLKGWLGLTLGVIIAAGGITYWLRHSRAAEPPATNVALPLAQTNPEAVPPEVRSYLDQAKGGDGKAMHMIALMYWNGLNVRQDRVKGLEWYRKAAAAGDKAAQKELAVIEGK
jgi:hypothetical protein